MSVNFTTYSEFTTELATLKQEIVANIGTSNKFHPLTSSLSALVKRIEGLSPEEQISAGVEIYPLKVSIDKMKPKIESNQADKSGKADLDFLGVMLPNEIYKQRRLSLSEAMHKPETLVS